MELAAQGRNVCGEDVPVRAERQRHRPVPRRRAHFETVRVHGPSVGDAQDGLGRRDGRRRIQHLRHAPNGRSLEDSAPHARGINSLCKLANETLAGLLIYFLFFSGH